MGVGSDRTPDVGRDCNPAFAFSLRDEQWKRLRLPEEARAAIERCIGWYHFAVQRRAVNQLLFEQHEKLRAIGKRIALALTRIDPGVLTGMDPPTRSASTGLIGPAQ
jgi:hypothetical protein